MVTDWQQPMTSLENKKNKEPTWRARGEGSAGMFLDLTHKINTDELSTAVNLAGLTGT